MELRQLKYFVAVAEARSFSAAALRLHISQPPLSTQIKSLEQEIGTRLFERSPRGVALTAAGEVFYDEARAMLARLDLARHKAVQAGRGDIGTLSIGFVSIADYGILPSTVKAFRSRYPAVDLQLHELTTDAQVRELRSARLDVGIALGPLREPDLDFERVQTEELILAAPAGHRLIAGDRPVDLASLAQESFVLPPREIAPGLHDLILDRCRDAGFAPRVTQQARQMQTVISLVACGMGFALVPSSVRKLERTGAQYRRLRGGRATIEIGILRARDRRSVLADNLATVLRQAAAEFRARR
ncbi:LysR family transcriptional regulator [Panacagrimonas sp.]|uniref:LysR family transcriptional regulator n=1 Tax=Panacagrimonas sp. TaxID=2480088 RepID=UPI003B51EC70